MIELVFPRKSFVQLQELACGKSVGLSNREAGNSVLTLIPMTKLSLAPEEPIIQEKHGVLYKLS